VNVHWQGDEVYEKLIRLITDRTQKAAVYLQGEVRKEINRGNRSGKNPSLPGEPPKKVTAALFRSINWAVRVTPEKIIGFVGTGLIYARRLELGFIGRDSAGRTINQAPRPFLRSTLKSRWEQIQRILKTGNPG
jgi:hypothetical protein